MSHHPAQPGLRLLHAASLIARDGSEVFYPPGDPMASVFLVIYVESLLVRLNALLHGLFVGGIREASLGDMDEVSLFSEDKNDIILVD
jgi:hypothetical protein